MQSDVQVLQCSQTCRCCISFRNNNLREAIIIPSVCNSISLSSAIPIVLNVKVVGYLPLQFVSMKMENTILVFIVVFSYIPSILNLNFSLH